MYFYHIKNYSFLNKKTCLWSRAWVTFIVSFSLPYSSIHNIIIIAIYLLLKG